MRRPEVDTIDKAIELIKTENFTAIFSEAADFLPLERALISQQANLILNTIGEGVCIVDRRGAVQLDEQEDAGLAGEGSRENPPHVSGSLRHFQQASQPANLRRPRLQPIQTLRPEH